MLSSLISLRIIFIAEVIGTEINIPIIPHTQPQKMREIRTTNDPVPFFTPLVK